MRPRGASSQLLSSQTRASRSGATWAASASTSVPEGSARASSCTDAGGQGGGFDQKPPQPLGLDSPTRQYPGRSDQLVLSVHQGRPEKVSKQIERAEIDTVRRGLKRVTFVEKSQERVSGIGSGCASNDRHAHDRTGAKGEERGLFDVVSIPMGLRSEGHSPLGQQGEGRAADPADRLCLSGSPDERRVPLVPGPGPQSGIGKGQSHRIATRVVESDQTGQARVIQDIPPIGRCHGTGLEDVRVEPQAHFGAPHDPPGSRGLI